MTAVRVLEAAEVAQLLGEAGLLTDPESAGPYECAKAWRRAPAACLAAVGSVPLMPYVTGDNARLAGFFTVCPTCGDLGSAALVNAPGRKHAIWEWNGSWGRPTLTPSIRSVPWEPGRCAGHWNISDGQLIVHGDSRCPGPGREGSA